MIFFDIISDVRVANSPLQYAIDSCSARNLRKYLILRNADEFRDKTFGAIDVKRSAKLISHISQYYQASFKYTLSVVYQTRVEFSVIRVTTNHPPEEKFPSP